MLIVGAKGFAKEVLEVLNQLQELNDLAFFDDINVDCPDFLYNTFPILKSIENTIAYFKTVDDSFTVGVGNPILRKKLADQFENMGGVFTSVISPLAQIGHFETTIGKGCNIMTGAVITNNVTIGCGVLINLNCTIGHDSIISDFVEMSPGVHISGNCKIGAFSNLGTNSTVLPNITIGQNVIVAAGAVVIKDIPDNCMIAGVPAVIKKQLLPLNF